MTKTFKLLTLMTTFTTLSLRADMGILLATLAEVETGATKPALSKADKKIGRDGEISRYQILPSVWIKHAHHTPLSQASDPAKSIVVAGDILSYRIEMFRGVKLRSPTLFEVYCLWNKPTWAMKGYTAAGLAEKAQRFENLVLERGVRGNDC